jgi:predicted nuclease of predicted toxin-antitoxin system
MKFLIDAQLPMRLAQFLQMAGHDAIHTREIPQQNRTPDLKINERSIQEERIVITKDYDFVNSFMAVRQPYKLLLVTTGNIKNQELERIFSDNLQTLVDLFQVHSYIEINASSIVVHQ